MVSEVLDVASASICEARYAATMMTRITARWYNLRRRSTNSSVKDSLATKVRETEGSSLILPPSRNKRAIRAELR